MPLKFKDFRLHSISAKLVCYFVFKKFEKKDKKKLSLSFIAILRVALARVDFINMFKGSFKVCRLQIPKS